MFLPRSIRGRLALLVVTVLIPIFCVSLAAAVKVYRDGPLVGQELRVLRERMPQVEARIAAIYRQDCAIEPDGDTVIQADDEIFFVAAPIHIRAVLGELGGWLSKVSQEDAGRLPTLPIAAAGGSL